MEQEIAQLIEAELLRGSGFQDGKNRIYEFALTNPTNSSFATFLKEEYGIGGHSGITEGISFVDHDGKGMRFKFTDKNEKEHKNHLTWTTIVAYIQNLIDEGRYHESQQLKPKDEQ